MKQFLILGTIVAMLLPAAVQAKIVSGKDITLQSCTITRAANGGANGINVVFVNTNSVAAKQVDFVVQGSGQTSTLTDHRTYKQGDVINHNLTTPTGTTWDYKSATPDLCKVNRVQWANGQVWGP